MQERRRFHHLSTASSMIAAYQTTQQSGVAPQIK